MLRVYLEDVPVPTPGVGEVVVAIDGAPVNPADIGALFGPADVSAGRAEEFAFVAPVPDAAIKGVSGRLDKPMPVGTEGTGLVVAAGQGAENLLGRRLVVFGGATYAQYRLAAAGDCLVMPEDVTAEEAASAYANPMTVMCMLHTMRRDGHTAMVHTAAASALGQMLLRLCLAEGVGLVCIVRGQSQAEILRAQGARHVCDSSSDSFNDDLTEAIAQTGATLGFDALGGGTMVSQILSAMETAISRKATGAYSRYGSVQHKHVYIYGGLAGTKIEITRNFGMAWSVGGWLLLSRLDSLSHQEREAMKARVVAELRTTFSTRFSRRVSLTDLINPEVIESYYRRATGQKILVDPQA